MPRPIPEDELLPNDRIHFQNGVQLGRGAFPLRFAHNNQRLAQRDHLTGQGVIADDEDGLTLVENKIPAEKRIIWSWGETVDLLGFGCSKARGTNLPVKWTVHGVVARRFSGTFVCRRYVQRSNVVPCQGFTVRLNITLDFDDDSVGNLLTRLESQLPKKERNWDRKSIYSNQSINQSINRSIDQSINQSINRSIDQSINQSIVRATGRSILQPINQSTECSLSLSHKEIDAVWWIWGKFYSEFNCQSEQGKGKFTLLVERWPFYVGFRNNKGWKGSRRRDRGKVVNGVFRWVLDSGYSRKNERI